MKVRRRTAARVVWTAVLAVWSLVCIGPLVWLTYNSLKTNAAVALDPWSLPSRPHFSNWTRVLTSASILPEPIGTYVINSLVTGVPAAVGAVLVGSAAAYGLVRYRLRGSGIFWGFLLLLLPVPVFAVMVPVYSYMSALGLTNSRAGLLVVYFAFNLAFAILLMRGFLQNVPKDIVEAASLDGCSDWGAFRRVVLPLARGPILAGGLLIFLGIWGEFPLSSVMMQAPSRMTIQPALASLAGSGLNPGDVGIEFSALALTTLVPVLIYLAAQRHIFSAVTGSWGEG